MTVSPNQPSTPHHQRFADIGDSAMEIWCNWCFEPILTELPTSLIEQFSNHIWDAIDQKEPMALNCTPILGD